MSPTYAGNVEKAKEVVSIDPLPLLEAQEELEKLSTSKAKSNKLVGKVALIARESGVGEGIVRAFLHEGATVVVPSRTSDKLEKLREYLGEQLRDRFIPIEGELSDVERAEQLPDRVMEKVSQLDAIALLCSQVRLFLVMN